MWLKKRLSKTGIVLCGYHFCVGIIFVWVSFCVGIILCGYHFVWVSFLYGYRFVWVSFLCGYRLCGYHFCVGIIFVWVSVRNIQEPEKLMNETYEAILKMFFERHTGGVVVCVDRKQACEVFRLQQVDRQFFPRYAKAQVHQHFRPADMVHFARHPTAPVRLLRRAARRRRLRTHVRPQVLIIQGISVQHHVRRGHGLWPGVGIVAEHVEMKALFLWGSRGNKQEQETVN